MSEKKIEQERAAFEEFWHDESSVELRKSCARGWAQYIWQACASLSVGVPDGYTIVPVEPTTKMYMAGAEAYDNHLPFVYGNVTHVFNAMLAAAPAAPTVKQSLSVAQAVKAEQVDMTDAYVGAREDLAIWKRRALEAEQKARHQEQIIDHLTLEAQGETRFGEPYLPSAEPVAVIEYAGYDPANSIKWLNKGLQAENGRLNREADESLAALVNQRDAARTQLEAARGLLREALDVLSRVPDDVVPPDHPIYGLLRRQIAAPAPEARQEAAPDVRGLVESASAYLNVLDSGAHDYEVKRARHNLRHELAAHRKAQQNGDL